MKDISFEQIEKMDCESRYEIFLTMVADDRDIWVLVNDNMEFLKLYSEEYDIEYLPIWPHSDFTAYYIKNAEEKLTPKCLSVPDFFAKWVTGLERDGLNVCVFPNSSPEVWIMAPSEVKSDLQDEFSNFRI